MKRNKRRREKRNLGAKERKIVDKWEAVLFVLWSEVKTTNGHSNYCQREKLGESKCHLSSTSNALQKQQVGKRSMRASKSVEGWKRLSRTGAYSVCCSKMWCVNLKKPYTLGKWSSGQVVTSGNFVPLPQAERIWDLFGLDDATSWLLWFESEIKACMLLW